MKELSHTLIALYEAAESLSPSAFPRAVVRALRPLLRFDAACLVMGEGVAEDGSSLLCADAFLYEGTAALEEPSQLFSDGEASASDLVAHLDVPLRSDHVSLVPIAGLTEFAQRHRLQVMMLFGSATALTRPMWIALYRRCAPAFGLDDSEALQTLWPHIERTVAMNRARCLERLIRRKESRAAALISRHGLIETADPRFLELLAIEWPASRGAMLPAAAMERLRAGLPFDGVRIRIVAQAQENLLMCKAGERNRLSMLTPAELAVARHFSLGLTHKDVALRLGVSQNTVRTHIKHVYDKLAIHNKAHLAQLMASRFEQRPD